MAYQDPCPPSPPVNTKFKLECVIVCAHYDDFLRETLPHNKQMFDRIVVVTSPDDKRTQKLCEFHHIECIPTHALGVLEGAFRKGAGINVGLNRLDKDGWVLHLDADIWLPPQTRSLLQKMDLDKSMLYGIDRFIVENFESWRGFVENPKLQQEAGSWVHTNAFRMGTRVMHGEGYIPIGFFQLWFPSVSGIQTYPAGHTSAAREDGRFALQWPRSKRHMIPDIIGYHLESERCAMGMNWNGRKTKRFGMCPSDEPEESLASPLEDQPDPEIPPLPPLPSTSPLRNKRARWIFIGIVGALAVAAGIALLVKK